VPDLFAQLTAWTPAEPTTKWVDPEEW